MSKRYCVESGDFFSFVRGKDEQDAAQQHIFNIFRLKGATLGETIVVKSDYKGKKLAKLNTEEMFLKFNPGFWKEIKFKKNNGIISFTKVPVSRSSKFERWQVVFRKSEILVKIDGDIWIRRGITMNPVTGDLP